MIQDTSSMDRKVRLQRPSRSIGVAITVVVLLLAIALAVPAMSRWVRADRSIDAGSVRTGRVVRGDLVRDVSVQAQVVAALSPTLFSPGQGIVHVATQPGARVARGEVLATIDSESLQSSLAQAQAQLESARADRDRQKIISRQEQLRARQQVELLTLRHAAAERQLARMERTFSEGLTNRSDLESARDDLKIAAMELEQARQELDLSREGLGFEITQLDQQVRRQQSVVRELQMRVDDLTIRAPFDGMVASVQVADRDAVVASQPIVQVVNLDSLEIELGLPEQYAGETVIGTAAVIQVGGREYAGLVTSVSPEVVNGQVQARVAFDGEKPEGLRQNQRLTTRLTFEAKRDVLKTPRGAFLEAEGGRAAYVVEGQMARRRTIQVGASSVGEVEILAGLEEGETIIVSDTTSFEDAVTVMLR